VLVITLVAVNQYCYCLRDGDFGQHILK
jgi:hypothetical protein